MLYRYSTGNNVSTLLMDKRWIAGGLGRNSGWAQQLYKIAPSIEGLTALHRQHTGLYLLATNHSVSHLLITALKMTYLLQAAWLLLLPLALAQQQNDHSNITASISVSTNVSIYASQDDLLDKQSYSGLAGHSGNMMVHIGLMVVAWFFILPIGMTLKRKAVQNHTDEYSGRFWCCKVSLYAASIRGLLGHQYLWRRSRDHLQHYNSRSLREQRTSCDRMDCNDCYGH